MNITWHSNKRNTTIVEHNGVSFLSFNIFQNQPIIQGFSTRLGGVSKNYLSSMNLSFQRGDEEENVRENYRRMGEAMGFDERCLVFSDQQHHTNLRIVTKDDMGKGITRERDFQDIDGLITNLPNIPLATFYADCVPLLFFDPVQKVIAASHSGWRGTVEQMGRVTVEKMHSEFGSKPEDILAAIGPSICKDCYEVDQVVYDQFRNHYSEDEIHNIFTQKENGHYQLDLWKANEYVLKNAGITPEHMQLPDLCTCCNPDFLYSHRASNGKRGNLAAFICLKA